MKKVEDLKFFASAQVTRDHQQYLLSYWGGGGGGGGCMSLVHPEN